MDPYSRVVKKTMEKHIPFIVHWELTYRCNLKCAHCYCLHDSESDELSLREIMSVLDRLAEMQTLFLTLSGGEVLVRDDFFEIARYARKKNFAIRLLTNGTRITDTVADELEKIHPLSVEMSLYAADAALHDAITGKEGSFEKTVRAFHLLHKRGLKTKVKSLLMKQNAHQLQALRELSRELGADMVYDFTVVPKDDGTKGTLNFRLDEKDMTEIFSDDDKASHFEPAQAVDDNTFMCSSGMNNFLISPYGEVYPCVGLKIGAGNVRKQSLEDINNSETLKKVRNTKFSELWACRDCGLSGYCTRCPGLAAAEDGDYLGPSQAYCRMARALKEARKQTKQMEV